MAKADKVIEQAVTEDGQIRDVEMLEFADLLEVAGDLKRTVNKAKRGNLADYRGQVVYILGVDVTKRGKKIVRMSLNSDRSDPSRVTAPNAVVDGLARAYSAKPGAVFRVKVVEQGKKSCTLASV